MALLIFVYAVSLVLVFGAEYASEWSRLPDGRCRRANRDCEKVSQGSGSAADEVIEPADNPLLSRLTSPQ